MFSKYFEVFKKGSFTFKYCFLTSMIMPIFYFIAIFSMPYEYYVFLQIITLIFVGGFACAYANNSDSMFNYPCISSWILVILFNPIVPFEFGKGLWIFFDIVAFVALLVSFFIMLGHFDAVMSLSPSQLSDFLGTKDKEEYIKRFTPQDDQFVKKASNSLQEWERDKDRIKHLLDQFLSGITNTITEIQSTVMKKIDEKHPCRIKQSTVAIIDFSYYIFFNLYVPLCNFASTNFCSTFYEFYEGYIRVNFKFDISDPDFFESFFNDRVDTYNRVCENSTNRFDDLARQAAAFIANDFSENYISDTYLSLPGITDIASALTEIKELYLSMTDELKSFRSELAYLNNIYNNTNNFIKAHTGHELIEFI